MDTPRAFYPGRRTLPEAATFWVLAVLFLMLFFVLIGVWLVMWIGMHIAGGMIHLLLIIAVISLVLHLFRGRRTA